MADSIFLEFRNFVAGEVEGGNTSNNSAQRVAVAWCQVENRRENM